MKWLQTASTQLHKANAALIVANIARSGKGTQCLYKASWRIKGIQVLYNVNKGL